MDRTPEPSFKHRWGTPLTIGARFVPYQVPLYNSAKNHSISNAIVQMRILADDINHEVSIVLETCLWSAPTSRWTPYTMEHFMKLVRNYSVIGRDLVRKVKGLEPAVLNKKVWLSNQTSAPKISGLLESLEDSLKSLGQKETRLMKAMSLSNEYLESLHQSTDPTRREVPAVSAREIRFWLALNTDAFHERLEQEAASQESLRIFVGNIGKIIDVTEAAPGPYARVTANHGPRQMMNRATTTSSNPVVFTICFGLNQARERIHPLVHVGATQERLPMWPGLSNLRNDARCCHMGKAASDWNEFFEGLKEVESWISSWTDTEKKELRQQLMEWRLGMRPNPPPGLAPEDLNRIIPVKRTCGHHMVQAYRPKKHTYESIDCCYSCKLSIGYREVKEVDIPGTADRFDLEGRSKMPWSCAEVLTSKYCDSGGDWGPE